MQSEIICNSAGICLSHTYQHVVIGQKHMCIPRIWKISMFYNNSRYTVVLGISDDTVIIRAASIRIPVGIIIFLAITISCIQSIPVYAHFTQVTRNMLRYRISYIIKFWYIVIIGIINFISAVIARIVMQTYKKVRSDFSCIFCPLY